jgi:hypothetical protein
MIICEYRGVLVPVYTQVTRTDGTRVRKVIAERVGDVELVVKPTASLRRYAEQALRNKSGRSVLADGAFVFQVTRSTQRAVTR